MAYKGKHIKEKAKKESFFKHTTSHFGFYLSQVIYIGIVIVGICLLFIFYSDGLVELSKEIMISLFAFTGVCGQVFTSFYYNKAKAEYTHNTMVRLCETKLRMAETICEKLNANAITPESVRLLSMLIGNISSHDETFSVGQSYNGISSYSSYGDYYYNNSMSYTDTQQVYNDPQEILG